MAVNARKEALEQKGLKIECSPWRRLSNIYTTTELEQETKLLQSDVFDPFQDIEEYDPGKYKFNHASKLAVPVSDCSVIQKRNRSKSVTVAWCVDDSQSDVLSMINSARIKKTRMTRMKKTMMIRAPSLKYRCVKGYMVKCRRKW